MGDDAGAAIGQLTAVDAPAPPQKVEKAPDSEEVRGGRDIADVEDSAPDFATGNMVGAPRDWSKDSTSAARLATLFGVAVVVVLAALVGWLGFLTYQPHQAQTQRSLYLRVAEQSALNLATIDWRNADADVRRILDGATGQFYNDFAKGSQPFIDVVKQTKSVTVGTVAAARLESESGRRRPGLGGADRKDVVCRRT